jgi:hypothetical protein
LHYGDPVLLQFLAIVPFRRCVYLRQNTHAFAMLRACKREARANESCSAGY